MPDGALTNTLFKMKKIVILIAWFPFQPKCNKWWINFRKRKHWGIDIAGGLKEALNNGISGNNKLTANWRFYRNEAVKIFTRGICEKSRYWFADSAPCWRRFKSIEPRCRRCRKKATPICRRMRNMIITDAKTILLGNQMRQHLIYKTVLPTAFGKNLIL
jgi:hypothetical protein